MRKRELLWVLHPEGFYLEVSGEDLNRIFISLPGVWSPLISQCQVRGSLVNEACPDVSHGCSVWFCCFSGPGAETQLKPGCHRLKGVVMQGLVVLSTARHPGFSGPVTLCAWPIHPTLLMPV